MSEQTMIDDRKIHEIIGEWCGEGTIGVMRAEIVKYISEVRTKERAASLERHAKTICGFCEQGFPLEYIPEPNCFKHKLTGETPWHTCWANDIRMAEKALEGSENIEAPVT